MPQYQYDLVIIGTGLAGYSLAREFRKLNSEQRLLLISQDDAGFYSKPMLSNAIAGNKTAQQLMMKPAEKMREELAADIWEQTCVSRIHPAEHSLTTSRGDVRYGRLVLATGASPRQLPLEGDGVSQVMSVNDLSAYSAFREQLEGKQRLAIIGPGLVGCEFANDLLRGGYEVQVIGPDEYPLSTLLPREVGLRMQRKLEAKGFHWHLQRTVQRVDRQANGLALQLSDKTTLEVDAVLSAVGLIPSTDLAREAGLQVNRGVVTDRHLACSEENIYALGDCAEVAGLWLPYVMPIMNAARALAKTLAGEPNELSYPPMPVVVKTPDFPLVLALPPGDAAGQWQISESEEGLRGLFVDAQENVLGFVLSEERVKEKQSLAKQLPPVLG